MKNEIGTKTDYSIEGLIENAIDVLKNEYEYDDIDNAIHEIADNETPIYYWDIAQYMAHNFELLHIDTSDKDSEIYEVVQAELYEQIYNGLSEFINSEEFQELKLLLSFPQLKDKAREE